MHEQPRKMGAHDPAAGEGAGGAVVVALAKSEAGQDLLGPGFEAVVLDGVLRRRAGRPGVVLGAGSQPHGGRTRDELQDGFVSHRHVFLGQESDGGAALPGQGAFVDGILAEDEAEQRGFARAVRADEPQAVAPQDREGHVREQRSGSETLGDAGERKHGKRLERKQRERVVVETCPQIFSCG